MNGGIKISMQEAFARMADGDPVEVRLDYVDPAVTTSQLETWSRTKAEARIKLNTPFESGPHGQEEDWGIYVYLVVYWPRPGIVRCFFRTKPECRLTPEQLQQSLARNAGENLFSSPVGK